MKRRVAIVRAVVDEPEIVLFDEPTTGLDPPTAGTICALGLKLRDVLGVSSIWVTHRIEDVRCLAPKLHTLRQETKLRSKTKESVSVWQIQES